MTDKEINHGCGHCRLDHLKNYHPKDFWLDQLTAITSFIGYIMIFFALLKYLRS